MVSSMNGFGKTSRLYASTQINMSVCYMWGTHHINAIARLAHISCQAIAPLWPNSPPQRLNIMCMYLLLLRFFGVCAHFRHEGRWFSAGQWLKHDVSKWLRWEWLWCVFSLHATQASVLMSTCMEHLMNWKGCQTTSEAVWIAQLDTIGTIVLVTSLASLNTNITTVK